MKIDLSFEWGRRYNQYRWNCINNELRVFMYDVLLDWGKWLSGTLLSNRILWQGGWALDDTSEQPLKEKKLQFDKVSWQPL